MPKWSRVQVENYYYSLYLLLLEEARQDFSKIGRNLNINDKSAAKLYRWALAEMVLLPPRLRLYICPNYQEYTYFLKIRKPVPIFEKLKNDPRVIYESICSGAFNMMIITNERVDFSMEHGFEGFVLSGPRGDFIHNKVERKPMGEFLDGFRDFLAKGWFTKSEIVPSVREKLVWDDLDLALFKLLKYDFRMKYIEIIRCLGLSKSVFYKHLHNVMDNCSIWTPYYPKGYPNYNGYFVLFQTDHEEQLIDQLKKIPVHCPMLKIQSWIYAYILIEKELRQSDFLDLLTLMQSSGFIEEYTLSIPIDHWKRRWTTQDLHHHSPRHME